MVKFLRIGPMVSGSNPLSAKISLRVRRVINSVIPGAGITRCGQIKGNVLDTAR